MNNQTKQRFVIVNTRVGLYESDTLYPERGFTNNPGNARIYDCAKDASEVAACLNVHGSNWISRAAAESEGR